MIDWLQGLTEVRLRGWETQGCACLPAWWLPGLSWRPGCRRAWMGPEEGGQSRKAVGPLSEPPPPPRTGHGGTLAGVGDQGSLQQPARDSIRRSQDSSFRSNWRLSL